MLYRINQKNKVDTLSVERIKTRKVKTENEKQNKKQRKEVEFYVKMFHEEKYRESLYDAREKLKKAYDTVTKDNIKKQMEKQLKLI